MLSMNTQQTKAHNKINVLNLLVIKSSIFNTFILFVYKYGLLLFTDLLILSKAYHFVLNDNALIELFIVLSIY